MSFLKSKTGIIFLIYLQNQLEIGSINRKGHFSQLNQGQR